MKKSNLSLKWLEVFQLAARSGSVQAAASEAGLSISTVSHHLRALETALGVCLMDHTRRPMRLTPTGTVFLRQVNEAMQILHQAELEVQSGPLSETRALSMSLVEDFDSDIAPELARILSGIMPRCTFRQLTRPSHETLQLLRDQTVELGIATRPEFDTGDLVEHAVLRDPFVLAVPITVRAEAETLLRGQTDLPLLRYSPDHIMGRMIEAHLRRLRRDLPNRFEFESNQTILSMVAEGAGWAITTPANYMRATRFQSDVRLLPFPGKASARYLSVFTTALHPSPAVELVASTLRQLVQTRAVDPAVERMPWLRDVFTVMAARAE